MSTVTAALIVRDEEQVIGDCLASLAGRVDQIVVIDTGSRDRTMEIVRRFPAELRQFEWRGDFAAARVVHFVAMSAISAFLVVHVAMALIVPASLLAMVRGR